MILNSNFFMFPVAQNMMYDNISECDLDCNHALIKNNFFC